ncbi:MAG: N-acetyltransferase [Anaerolineaceae bacterium]|nr:N-acetyltransferase [Anaerolineaceae bacterium]
MSRIRMATPADAPQIQAIYEPIVRETIISFELEPPTIEDMVNRITATTSRYPWLVCEQDDKILGYVYAGAHRSRAAYQWSVDVSVYVHTEARRRGIGRALYTSLFGLLVVQGFYNAYAGIALPNPGSIRIHEAMGMVPVGIYKQVGYKFNAWHDVGWWQVALQSHTDTQPSPPLPVTDILNTLAWDEAVATGLSLVKI